MFIVKIESPMGTMYFKGPKPQHRTKDRGNARRFESRAAAQGTASGIVGATVEQV